MMLAAARSAPFQSDQSSPVLKLAFDPFMRSRRRACGQSTAAVVHFVRMKNPEENPDWSISLSSLQHMAVLVDFILLFIVPIFLRGSFSAGFRSGSS